MYDSGYVRIFRCLLVCHIYQTSCKIMSLRTISVAKKKKKVGTSKQSDQDKCSLACKQTILQRS